MEASHFAAPARPYSQRALACVGQLADQVRQMQIPRKYFYPLQLQTLIISRAQDPARRAAIEAAIAEMDEQYGEVFQRLAE